MILSASDIAIATRHFTAMNRQRSVQIMIEKNLLCEDNYFVRKLVRTVKIIRGYAKQLPKLNNEESRFDFITTLAEFDISWDLFKSCFDLRKNGRNKKW